MRTIDRYAGCTQREKARKILEDVSEILESDFGDGGERASDSAKKERAIALIEAALDHHAIQVATRLPAARGAA